MKRILMTIMIGAVIAFAFIGTAAAEEPSLKEILGNSDRARGNVGGIVWNIEITTNEEGVKESRGMLLRVKGANSLARFTEPPNTRDRMVLMKDRNMWFIRSGLKKPVSISPRQKLLGDAANGDIASTNYVDDYDARMLGEETVNNEECYVLDLKARNKNVTYDGIKYWVSKKRLVGVKAEFFTISGKLFKIAEFKYDNRVTLETGESIPFVSELVIRDAVIRDRITTMTYSNVRVEEIRDSAFNLNVLLR